MRFCLINISDLLQQAEHRRRRNVTHVSQFVTQEITLTADWKGGESTKKSDDKCFVSACSFTKAEELKLIK